MASKLCGQASFTEQVRYRGADRGERHTVWHDVMTPDMIRQLPNGYALVIRGGLSPVVARLPAVWKNPAYRQARRLGQAIACLTPAHERPGPSNLTPRRAMTAWPEPYSDDEIEPASELVPSDSAYPWS